MYFSREETNTQAIKIDSVKLPLTRGLSDRNFKTGDTLVYEVEVLVNEPAIHGYNGMVCKVRPKGYRTANVLELVRVDIGSES